MIFQVHPVTIYRRWDSLRDSAARHFPGPWCLVYPFLGAHGYRLKLQCDTGVAGKENSRSLLYTRRPLEDTNYIVGRFVHCDDTAQPFHSEPAHVPRVYKRRPSCVHQDSSDSSVALPRVHCMVPPRSKREARRSSEPYRARS